MDTSGESLISLHIENAPDAKRKMKKKEIHLETDTNSLEVNRIQLENLVGHLMRCGGNYSKALFRDFSPDTEITARQLGLLLTLRNHGAMTQKELSQRTRIDNSTINEMVLRMDKRGLVESRLSQSDRRAKEVFLLEPGKRLLEESLPGLMRSQEMMISILPREYQRVFLHCLQMMMDSYDKYLSENGRLRAGRSEEGDRD
jgi:DNA-binding MarR family transcriptional regulator